MNYKFSSLKQVLDLFQNNEELGATEISNRLGKSRVVVHRYLKELISQKKLKKVGEGPHTKYLMVSQTRATRNTELVHDLNDEYIPPFQDKKIIEEAFYKFAADGKIMQGFSGFKGWCSERNFDIKERSEAFISIYKHIECLQDECGLLNATDSFQKLFSDIYLSDVYYADQYMWMEFGRGKLAEMTFYAKQSQNKTLIKDSISEILIKLECIIRKGGFDAIAITPWSIDRKNQLLAILKDELKFLGLPFVNIIKYYPNGIPIPQKSLKTREQRMQNAKNTIFVNDKNTSSYKKVFLIDDFVGSGSTLNETASKLVAEGIQEVHGFAFVGNLDLNYDVINEV